jgi:hypothetical protein
VAFALGLGVAPGPILNRSAGSVDSLLTTYRMRLAESRRAPEAPARMLRAGGPMRLFAADGSAHGGRP